ncbi:hypothetical protein HYS82_00545 [Candidatus Amesbacteria bacterium]|nr:hypothetical protein [Candidatus Amesbacteria bacterium]MBI2587542.1 hypothetical protein [Candidatus Amesbacteria bacterium]
MKNSVRNVFKGVKEGEKIDGGRLTADGAAALNGHRSEVARGERPSVVEILVRAILAGKEEGEVELTPEKKGAVERLKGTDEVTFPGRQPWSSERTGDWISKATAKKR